MTIKELKQQISNLPDTMDVFIAERKTHFAFGLANSAKVKTISFSEDDERKDLCYDNVLVIDEE